MAAFAIRAPDILEITVTENTGLLSAVPASGSLRTLRPLLSPKKQLQFSACTRLFLCVMLLARARTERDGMSSPVPVSNVRTECVPLPPYDHLCRICT